MTIAQVWFELGFYLIFIGFIIWLFTQKMK